MPYKLPAASLLPLLNTAAPPLLIAPARNYSLSSHTQHHFSIQKKNLTHIAMAGRRFATFGGLAAVGGATYYLYSAGGDAKLAEKKFERM